MTAVLWIFDGLLVVTLAGIALAVLRTPDLFKAVVLFIVFGLLMAVAWTRLGAVDIALAEAAIGAGVTGALFLNALGDATAEPQASRQTPVLLLLVLGAGVVLGAAVWALPRELDGLAEHVGAALDQSGASNPVTAVLLNFRAYDTLLEIAVLLVAAGAVWALPPVNAARRLVEPAGLPLLAFVRVLLPIIAVVAGYLLWIGTRAPGGAFQAGAVLSAAGILLLVTNQIDPVRFRAGWGRTLLVLGFGVFLGVGLGVMAAGHRVLEYPPGLAGRLILLIEAVLTVSIALVLTALFAGGRSDASPTEPPPSAFTS